MKPSAVEIGRQIKRLRIAKGLMQKELAKRLCVSHRCISRWETGKRFPKAAIRPKLAKQLGATMAEIFLERSEYLALLRSNAMAKSLEILNDGTITPAKVNAATNTMVRAKVAPEEKSVSAREKCVASLKDEQVEEMRQPWPMRAGRAQLAPGGEWTIWLFLGGRGAGKTRAGAEWIRERAESGQARRIALVGATAADVRDVMVEGDSGLLAIAPASQRPVFEPSKRRLTWPSGAVATLYSAEEPESLRGPQHDTAWCDELAKWSRLKQTWDNLLLGMRLGARPQVMISTTPKPLKLIKDICARSDAVITRATTYDNRNNLAPAFFAEIVSRYEGTRLGRQEVNAELIEDLPGALWTRAHLEDCRLVGSVPNMQRIVIGVDPSGTRGGDGRDSVGIVAAGKGSDGLFYVLADYTCSLSPAAWGRRVAEAARTHAADCVVAEANFGGAMVESVLKTAGVTAAVKMVTASRGKIVRAEPIASLYEQGRVKHVKPFAELEDQLCGFTTEGYAGSGSPDRADALIWALTELTFTYASGWHELIAKQLALVDGRR
jgi:phage terminase large subunit-like protein/transcriptional regulator with XRE-family HTH domain